MNEKAIVKRMKAAAKAAGCKIWRNEHDVLVLCGGGWCFVCEWGNCPPAVLGCLATTGGGTLLPAKDETQMPWGRWGREGRLLFLETENCVAPATTSKLEALDCWEEDRL